MNRLALKPLGIVRYLRCAPRILFFAALALSAQSAWGQAVGPAIFEGQRQPKASAERAAAAQPPSLGLSLPAPAAVALPPLGPDDLERLQPQEGLTPVGVHRSLPQGAAALSFSGGAAKTTVAGAWQATVVGRLWRLRITSPAARALRIHFQDFDVGGGSVWVHASDGRVDGTYSGRGMYGDGDFWSGIVFGGSATIEYLPGPAAAEEAVPFRIAAVSHIWGGPGFMGDARLSAPAANAQPAAKPWTGPLVGVAVREAAEPPAAGAGGGGGSRRRSNRSRSPRRPRRGACPPDRLTRPGTRAVRSRPAGLPISAWGRLTPRRFFTEIFRFACRFRPTPPA